MERFVNAAGLAELWGRIKAALGGKLDAAVYDPTGKARDIFAYADEKHTAVTQVPVTLSATGWKGSGQIYTQTVSVPGLRADQCGTIGLADAITDLQFKAACAAMIRKTGQAEGSLTVQTYGSKPLAPIPCVVTLLG